MARSAFPDARDLTRHARYALNITFPTDAIHQLSLMEDDAIELDTAALQLAALDHPGIDLDPYLDLLKGIAERLVVVGGTATTARARANMLARVLASEFRFTGDSHHYDDPANADLIRVIDRRRGLPVSLTILYVAAARRAGWCLAPLNMPGHVLARVNATTNPVLIDPFSSGQVVHSEQLAREYGGMLGPTPVPAVDQLAPMANRQVLVRLLMNQGSRADAAGDRARALTLYERMTIIAPTHSQAWWEFARLQLHGGDVVGARASLAAILEVTRDPTRRLHVRCALDALAESS
jgi:regulator of sirC expression with transglutaminase-like and TPR domain